MPRTESYLDAMMRHLGAAYYRSLHGETTHADLTRALETVEDHLDGGHHPRGWARRVGDVMRTSVVTVHGGTAYKEIARLLAEFQVSGMPVLGPGRAVVGVVTEADLLAAQARTVQRLHAEGKGKRALGPEGHPSLIAADLMSTPAITIGPHATIPAAARLMNARRVKMLPVVDDKGMLLGIVTRSELLSVFLRPDEDIASDIRRMLQDLLAADVKRVDVTVRDGVVTISGDLDPATGPHGDLIPVAIRVMWTIDGVVDVIDRLGQSQQG